MVAWHVKQIWEQPIEDVSMALDADGNLHIAGSRRDEIVYLTNSAGAWSLQPIATPDGLERIDHVVATAIDGSGRIAVAYERSDCPPRGCLEEGGEVRVAVIEPGETETRAVELGDGLSPSIALHEGVVSVVWLGGRWTDDNAGCPRPAMFATNATGDWATSELVSDAANGAFVSLRTDGTPVVATANGCDFLPDAGYLITLAPDRAPRREPIPAMSQGDWMPAVATDGGGRTHLTYQDFDDQIHYVVRDERGWSRPVAILNGLYPRGLAADAFGSAHLLGTGNGVLAYTSNSTGSFVEEQVTSKVVSAPRGTSTVLVDSNGSPHVLFAVADQDGAPAELWYATAIH